MKTGTILGIALGVGIPCLLILIGILGLVIKFFMRRCQKRPWDDISSLPKNIEAGENNTNRRPGRRSSSEREALYPRTTNNVLEVSDGHVAIPVDDNYTPSGQTPFDSGKPPENTLVQIKRDRLNRLKEEETRSRPMLRLSDGEDDIQRAIDQAQKDFEESV